MRVSVRMTCVVIILMALLVACAPDQKSVVPPQALNLKAVAFSDLPAWSHDRHTEALATFKLSCPKLLSSEDQEVGERPIAAANWAPVCRAAKAFVATDGNAAKKFFEGWFSPFLVSANGVSSGLFTGYFEAELRGSLTRSERFHVPLFGMPLDLVRIDLGQFDSALNGHRIVGRLSNRGLVPYFRRSAIQHGALGETAPVVAWVDDVIDAFLLQVQGSGRVRLDEGGVLRVGFAGHNGHGYVSIGRVLIDAGELSPGRASWRDIREWIARNPTKVDALLGQNPRYIFFRKISGAGPIGAQGVPLTPRRSLAVDPKFIPLGAPLWLDTKWPGPGDRRLRRLMIAQDAGSAIKGPIRGDFFWGYGKSALAEAGRMKSRGRYFILLPRLKAIPVF